MSWISGGKKAQTISSFDFSYVPSKIPGLIESNDAELRNQAGETIAVLYEIAREIHSVCRIDQSYEEQSISFRFLLNHLNHY